MTNDEIKIQIKKEEGLRLEVYTDITGNLTVGYGHLLVRGSTIPLSAAELIFEADYKIAVDGYNSLDLNLDPVRRSALIDMIFNMGINRVKKFHHMLFALREGDWVRAANELMDSVYARQLPERAGRNSQKILKG